MRLKPLYILGTIIGLWLSGQGIALADVAKGQAAIIRGDFPAAFQEFKAEAEKGNVLAQAAVGVMLHLGQGTKRDLAQAFSWYRKAAEKGYAAGQANVGMMYYKGAGTEQNDVEAYAWLDLASANRGGREHNAKAHVANYLSEAQMKQAESLAKTYRRKYLPQQ